MKNVIQTVEYNLEVADEKVMKNGSVKIPMRIDVHGWRLATERALLEKGADTLMLDNYYQARLLESLNVKRYPLMLEEAQKIKNEEKSK